jgi:dUTP pyrophosphatase
MTLDHRILVKLLTANAKIPTVSNAGDLGYDVYAIEDQRIHGQHRHELAPAIVRTGIAVSASLIDADGILPFAEGLGLIVKDRSSMAMKGIFTHGGVIDSGYRGEIKIIMTSLGDYDIKAGDKIAQIVPVRCYTGTKIQVVEEFDATSRGVLGFGSTGK